MQIRVRRNRIYWEDELAVLEQAGDQSPVAEADSEPKLERFSIIACV